MAAGFDSPIPVKICGLTRAEDAREAVRLGARYLGVIFAGGPRQVDLPRARAVVGSASQVPVIGVFGEQGEEEILEVCRTAGLAGAQLHGGHSPERITRLEAAGLLVVPVVHLGGADDLPLLDPFRARTGPVLVEPRVPGRLGGTGVALDVELARQARARLPHATMVLAGGLTPETVAAAARAVRPDVVDVSSGVEQIPGIKDHRRMARFLEELGWL